MFYCIKFQQLPKTGPDAKLIVDMVTGSPPGLHTPPPTPKREMIRILWEVRTGSEDVFGGVVLPSHLRSREALWEIDTRLLRFEGCRTSCESCFGRLRPKAVEG